MFSNASNIHIHGGIFNALGRDGTGAPGVDEALKILHANGAFGALHDSGERFSPPKCHPNTRVSILNDIMDWLNDPHSSHAAMWMRGAAGAGKSAIAQTIAQMCYDRGQLSASFFFARFSNAGRNDEKRLVATLVYQLLRHIPELRPCVLSAIRDDPLIFDSSLQRQVEVLLVAPISKFSDAAATTTSAKLFIIDGLDECLRKEAQDGIISVLVSALARMQHKLPHKLLITSRPEQNILSTFNNSEYRALVKHLSLDDSWDPDIDIRTFLNDTFAKISHSHPLSRLLSGWPPPADIENLVAKSSGQFIYAAVIIQYIQSNQHHPIERLKVVLGLVKDNKNRPFAELDALYTHIFSNVEERDIVLRVLRIIVTSIDPPLTALFLTKIQPLTRASMILGLPEETIELAFNNLVSVMVVKDSQLTFLHASLPDFLWDETRSARFYINNETICGDLSRLCLRHLSNSEDHLLCILCMKSLKNFASNLPSDARPQTHAIMSDIANISSLKSVISSPNLSELRYKMMLDATGGFFQWLLKENQRLSSQGGTITTLLPSVIKIQEWLLAQFHALPFSGFDNLDNLDFWIFSTYPRRLDDYYLYSLASDLQSRKGTDGRSKLPPTVTPSITLCWALMPFIVDYLDDLHLGNYSMTKHRYTYATLHQCRKLFNETKKYDFDIAARVRTTTFFLSRAALDVQLYSALLWTRTVTDDGMEDEDDYQGISRGAYQVYGSLRDFWKIDEAGGRKPEVVKFASAIVDLRDFWKIDEAGGRKPEVVKFASAIVDYLKTTPQAFF